MRRGYTLLEAMVYMALLLLVIALLTGLFTSFHGSYHRTRRALSDLEVASRFLEDVKGDLRRARKVSAEGALLRLRFGETEAAYRFDGEGSVVREGDGPSREYPSAFALVAFAPRPGRTVALEVELRREDPTSAFRPRWGGLVYCRAWEE